MLSKRSKISAREFKQYYSESKKTFTSFFRVGVCPSEQHTSQFAVVIPKKIIKHAFARNREKRRIYALLRDIQKTLSSANYYFIFLQKDTRELSHDLLEQEIKKIF